MCVCVVCVCVCVCKRARVCVCVDKRLGVFFIEIPLMKVSLPNAPYDILKN